MDLGCCSIAVVIIIDGVIIVAIVQELVIVPGDFSLHVLMVLLLLPLFKSLLLCLCILNYTNDF